MKNLESLCLSLIIQLQEMLPALKYLRGEAFSEKHWVELFNIIKAPFKPVDLITFADFMEVRQAIKVNIDSLQVGVNVMYYPTTDEIVEVIAKCHGSKPPSLLKLFKSIPF